MIISNNFSTFAVANNIFYFQLKIIDCNYGYFSDCPFIQRSREFTCTT